MPRASVMQQTQLQWMCWWRVTTMPCDGNESGDGVQQVLRCWANANLNVDVNAEADEKCNDDSAPKAVVLCVLKTRPM